MKSRRQTLREARDELDRLRYLLQEERDTFRQRVAQATEAYRFEIAQMRAQHDEIMKHVAPLLSREAQPFFVKADKEETLSGVVRTGKLA